MKEYDGGSKIKTGLKFVKEYSSIITVTISLIVLSVTALNFITALNLRQIAIAADLQQNDGTDKIEHAYFKNQIQQSIDFELSVDKRLANLEEYFHLVPKE